MKKDISTSEDIITLVDTFYNKVKSDSIIGYIFNDIAKVNWNKHLPRMYKFWEFALLGTAVYKGNPMMKHIALNTKETLTKEHFEQWVHLWEATIDCLFEGEIANRAKERGQLMKTVMYIKMEKINN
jgi:hemoglobin